MIRSILAGNVWTQDRWHRSEPNKHSSPNCTHCANAVPEDLQHLWWDCAAWNHIRREHPAAVAARSPSWPCCLAFCGIMPQNLYDTLAERTRIATAVQFMLASILRARHEREQVASASGSDAPVATSITRLSGYPRGWRPPGPHDRFAVDLPALPLPRKLFGVCKHAHYAAICDMPYFYFSSVPSLVAFPCLQLVHY